MTARDDYPWLERIEPISRKRADSDRLYQDAQHALDEIDRLRAIIETISEAIIDEVFTADQP